MYLVDTNVWLERLLDQERSQEIGRFIAQTSSEYLFITDFAFHSIAVVLVRLDRINILLSFVQDAFIDGAVSVVHLEPQDIRRIASVIELFKLDFDDAYQYVAAEKNKLILVSLDTDFDRTEHGRKRPEELIR